MLELHRRRLQSLEGTAKRFLLVRGSSSSTQMVIAGPAGGALAGAFLSFLDDETLRCISSKRGFADFPFFFECENHRVSVSVTLVGCTFLTACFHRRAVAHVRLHSFINCGPSAGYVRSGQRISIIVPLPNWSSAVKVWMFCCMDMLSQMKGLFLLCGSWMPTGIGI
jgi:hypothetical protein